MSNTGRTCKVHYTGTFNDGTKFDSSYDRGEPIEFVCGAGQMIPGFDQAVEGMNVGDIIDVHLRPEDAYGMPDPEAIIKAPLSDMPGAENLEVGNQVYLANSMGQQFLVKVIEKDDESITFDANHEMAYPGGGGVPGPIPFVYPSDADPVLALPILSAIASDECSPSLFNSSPIKYPPLLVNSQIHIQYIVHFITHIYYLLCTRADSSRLTTLSIHTGAVSLYAKLPDSNKQYNLPLYEYICSNFCGSLSSCFGVSLL